MSKKDRRKLGQPARLITISIPDKEEDLTKHLDSIPNKSKYLRKLIERDMKETKGVGSLEEELLAQAIDLEQEIYNILHGEKYRDACKAVKMIEEGYSEEQLSKLSESNKAYVRYHREYKRLAEERAEALRRKIEEINKNINILREKR